MRLTGDRLITFYRRLPPSAVAISLIVIIVLLANGMYVFGFANNDPISWTAGISHHLCRLTCGRPAIDPNVGFITQTLGHQAAMDLLHGHIPWWNYFQGLGQPLAGEMQAAALFPLTLLFALPAGLVWFHIVLEVIAGISTYFLARRLSLPIFFATLAGMLFALNGTFAWLGNAVLNPVAFLPMLVLGVEMILDSSSSSTKRGWYIAAIALALSLYAGFPEVAYMDGLFAGVWAIVRLFQVPRLQRPRALRRLGLGGVMGVILALPVLIPFDDYLKVAFVGGHTAAVDGALRLPPESLATFFDPYVFGTIFSNTVVDSMWGEIGGYFGAGICVLALVGLFGPKLRSLRIFLGIWTAVAVAGAFDWLGFRRLWNLIPLVDTSSYPRYVMASCELAIVVLAVLGLYDFTLSTRAKRLFTTAGIFMVLLLLWCVNEARPYNKGTTFGSSKIHIVFIGLQLLPFIALFLLLVLGRLHRFRWAPFVIALVIVGESLLYFFVPTAESPKQITIDYAPIHFLQTNQGEERFLDFAVLYPNWGTEFGINELSDLDLPFPRSFKNMLENQLDPGLTPGNQFVVKGGMIGVEHLEYELAQHFKVYEDASVKYLLIPSSVVLSARLVKLGVTQVFRDSLATIYELPHPRSFFSTANSTCTITSTSDDEATVDCPRPTKLLRTELSMKGWRAYVNGKQETIVTRDHVYQQISVPAGTSTVTYSFSPPHARDALIVGALGGLFLIGSFVNERYPFVPTRRRPKHRSRD
ncbi:MAG: hypothetical protein WCA31_03700 [Acidimicrobiales bacterium]